MNWTYVPGILRAQSVLFSQTNVFICWQYQAETLAIPSKEWISRSVTPFNNTYFVWIWIECKSQDRCSLICISTSPGDTDRQTTLKDMNLQWTHDVASRQTKVRGFRWVLKGKFVFKCRKSNEQNDKGVQRKKNITIIPQTLDRSNLCNKFKLCK